jgi:hypothetical protein
MKANGAIPLISRKFLIWKEKEYFVSYSYNDVVHMPPGMYLKRSIPI